MTKPKTTRQSVSGSNIPVYVNKPDTLILEREAKKLGISKNALIKNIVKENKIFLAHV